VALTVGPLLYAIALRSRRDLFPANWHAQQEAAEVASTVEATVTGVRVVKGFGQESRELTGLEERARTLFASRLRVVRFTSRYNPALQAVPALGQVAVLALGGWMALHGRISLGTFLAFTTYLGSFVTPVRQVATLLTVWQQARAGAERVLEVVDEAPVITDAPGARELPDDPGHPPALAWRDVTFAYGDEAPLLDGFTLDVRPGETVALIGSAGSGKSTAAALLPRFYDVPSGSVTVDGTDVRELSLASLRSRIGYVFEESLLLSDTVRANIVYGAPDATDEQIREAASIARADTDFDETLGALTDLVRQGKIRYIGTSTFEPSAIVEGQWIAERRGRERVVAEQPPYSLLARGIEREVLPVAQRYGLGVLSWSPLAGGWLTGRYRKGGEQPASSRAERQAARFDITAPENAAKLEAADALAVLAEEAGLTLVQLALAFVLEHPAVTSAIIGPRTFEQLESQLGADKVRLSRDVLDRIDEIVPPGTNLSARDAGYTPAVLSEASLRRRSA